MTEAPESVVVGESVHRSKSGWANRMDAAGLIGIGMLVVIVAVSLIGPFFVPAPASDPTAILQDSSSEHPLGTDFAGRDNLSLLVHGGADMLLLAVVAGVVSAAIALLVGVTAGAVGGAVDRALTYLTDLWLTIPRFILLLVVASLIELGSTATLAVLIAIFSWPYLARQIRALTLSVNNRPYVEASKSLGMGIPFVIRHCLIPPMAPFLIISTIQAMIQAIYQQVGLAFFGIIPLSDNWGVLFSLTYRQNALYSPTAALSLLGPVAAIVLLQLSLVLTSRTLEERFDPRLRDT